MKITVKKNGGYWKVRFNHEVQFFTLDYEAETKEEAEWMKDRLTVCFNKAFGEGWERSGDKIPCPNCGSKKVYKTPAIHCTKCEITTEI